MADNMQLTVTAKRRIVKYAEGADPEKDEPMSIEEKEIVLVGDEAKRLLDEMGVNHSAAIADIRSKREEHLKGAGRHGIN